LLWPDGLLWLLLMLGPLIFFQRTLHKELQCVIFLITRKSEVTLVVFSIIFLPGVILHELSHYLTALILRIPTGRFSLIPQNLGNGRLQLGYVETAKADIIRDALVGVAPLLTGGLFVGFVGQQKLGLLTLWEALVTTDLGVITRASKDLFEQPDFWFWFYLTVVISSTMVPSPSDRRAWIPVILVVCFLIGIGYIAGIGQWMMIVIDSPLNDILRSVAIVFAMSVGIHLIILLPVWVIRKLLNHLTGYEVSSAN
jgi:hypothetical protein